jgi:hypothetical protein
MTEAQKDTVYIDVDDEITGIIDKVKDSPHKIVALVLPKRATVLQSIVNMKLLNRSAKTAKKSLVLITSEAGLMPLAGAVGIHVAKNLQSKPAIPAGPDQDEIPESLVHEEEIDDDEPEIDDKKPIGELAGVAAVAAAEPLAADESIDLGDEEEAAKPTKKAAKTPKDKKLRVPNFERFRKLLIFGGIALVVLIVGSYFAFVKLPKATIVITTDSSNTTMNVAFTASTTIKTYDEAAKVVPAELPSVTKTATQSVPATGQKNIGNKATGNVSMTAKVCSSFSTPDPVPSGTGVSANGQTYITQQNVSFTPDTISGGCINFKSGGTTINAQNAGVAYNTGSTAFTVAGRSDVTASGSASGGTDNIAKVVSQADVDAAKAKLNAQAESDGAKTELTNTLNKDSMFVISSSFAVNGPTITTTPNVGDQADNVTVNSTATYTLLGVNQDYLNKLIAAQAKGQIDTSKQAVQDTGLSTATFVVQGKDNPQVTVTTSVTIGPNLDTDAIKKDIAGKKKGETIDIIQSRPSIKGVTVNYSPFWVIKTPKDPKKVTITFNKAGN